MTNHSAGVGGRRLDWPLVDDLFTTLLAALRSGATLGHPTETVYGLGAEASEEGVRRLRKLKGGFDTRPFVVLVGDDWHRSGLVVAPPLGIHLARIYWPGPLTMVLPPGPRAPSALIGPTGGIAVRHSSHEVARDIATELQWGLLSTSANRPGASPNAQPIPIEWPGSPDFWIDQAASGEQPSTLVTLVESEPRTLRDGPICIDWTSLGESTSI